MTKEEYLRNPCRASALPYWKTISYPVSPNICIIHDEQYEAGSTEHVLEQRFFKLIHWLKESPIPSIDQCVFDEVHKAQWGEVAAFLTECYEGSAFTAKTVEAWTREPVYDPTLWIWLIDSNGQRVALGIGQLDTSVAEGVLDWIQVHPKHRHRGFGQAVVLELLRRMQGRAAFVTVSGDADNPCDPQLLYRKCGFQGSQRWHVLRLKARP